MDPTEQPTSVETEYVQLRGAEEDVWGFAPPSDKRLRVNGKHFAAFRAAAQGSQRRSVFFLPVLHPLGRPAFYWGFFITLVDMTYTAFLVPLMIAFLPTSWRSTSSFNFLVVADFVGSAIYVFDFFINFHIGFVVLWDARWVPITDGRLVAWYYIRHGSFVINLIAIVPVALEIGLIAAGDVDLQALHLVFLLQLLRLVRVVAVVQALARPGAKSRLGRALQRHVPASVLLICNAVFGLGVLLNLLGCIWWALAVAEGLENSWAATVEAKDVDLLTADAPTQYLYSLYYAVTVISTTGFGDITPRTDVEIGVTLLYMVLGIAIFGFLINVASEVIALGQPRKSAAELADRMQTVEYWMEARGLPVALRGPLRSYYQRLWLQNQVQEEAELYAVLPPELKQRVRKELQSFCLTQAPLFQGVSPAARQTLLAVIARLAVPVAQFPGHEVYAKGQPADCFFILDEGRVTARMGSGWAEASFSGPAVLGLSAMFGAHIPECATHSQTVTAVSGCHLWRVESAEFERELGQRHLLVLQEVAVAYLERIRGLLKRGEALLGEGAHWGTPQAQHRQQLALSHLERMAAGLEAYVAAMAAPVAAQQKLAEQEAAAREEALQRQQRQQQQGAGNGSGAPPAAAAGSHAHALWGAEAAATLSSLVGLGEHHSASSSSPFHAAHAQLSVGTQAPGLLPPNDSGVHLLSPSRRDLMLDIEMHDVSGGARPQSSAGSEASRKVVEAADGGQ